MTTILSIVLFSIFLVISLIHFYWAFGGKWGSDAVLPTKEDNKTRMFEPTMWSTIIVAFVFLGFGLIVLPPDGDKGTPLWLDAYGIWIIGGIFALRAIGDFNYVGFFKKIKQTKFAVNDTKYFSPLCLIIAILILILELNK